MEKIEPGKYVALSYDLYDVTDGKDTLMHQVTAENPERFVFGVTPGVIEPLMEAVKGKARGEEFSVTLAPADGFGEYNDGLLRTEELPADLFKTDGKIDAKTIFPGAQIYLQTNVGQEVPAVVLEVEPATVKVKVDFNHPLAGRTVKLTGKVEDVRPATAEEVAAHSRAAAGGCGGCGGGSCGSGCGSGCSTDETGGCCCGK